MVFTLITYTVQYRTKLSFVTKYLWVRNLDRVQKAWLDRCGQNGHFADVSNTSARKAPEAGMDCNKQFSQGHMVAFSFTVTGFFDFLLSRARSSPSKFSLSTF
jgi:hypothetical protein